jgi:hypothetical protein
MAAAARPEIPWQELHRVALRQVPEREDADDPRRLELLRKRFHGQDGAYLGFAKTVEEHIRMLCGRQWDVWSDYYGRYVDTLQYMTEQERKWRMRPVMDYLGYWFVLTLSKVIENQPVISFMPSTADRLDATLAEVMDPIWKTLMDQMEMDQRRSTMAGWLLTAGEGYYMTRADFTRGDRRQLIRPAVLTLNRPGSEPIERSVDAVPFDARGNPLAKLVADPDRPGDYGYDVTGEPYEDLEGMPAVEVLCPLQVRAQWGAHIPWRDKRWVIVENFQLPEQIYDQTGVHVEPDHYVASDDGPGYLERMLFGTGYFGGGQSHADPSGFTTTMSRVEEGYVRTLTMWEKPITGFTDECDEHAGGRLLIGAPNAGKILWDSYRPFRTECAGPIRRVRYIDIPGRPQGSTSLEKLVPLQKRLNRVEAHIAQHTNLAVDPILMIHEACGIDSDEFVATPGLVIEHGYNGPGNPAYYLVPPPISGDIWKHKADLREQIFVIGSMMGNQSAAPTENSSGELVEQLRQNADRPLTPLTQSLAMAEADVAQDVVAVLPTIWTEEKIIAYAGTDSIMRTTKVLPHMFDGRVRVKPSLEAAAAESKDARRTRLIQLFQLGAFGDITDPAQRPKAVQQLLQLVNFPDLNRMARPGGIDRIMGEHNVQRLLRGDQAQAIPLLPVYDFDVHLDVLRTEMKAPEYLSLGPDLQAQFVALEELLLQAGQAKVVKDLTDRLPVEQARARAAGAVAQTAALHAPQPSPGPSGAPPSPPPTAPADSRAA